MKKPFARGVGGIARRPILTVETMTDEQWEMMRELATVTVDPAPDDISPEVRRVLSNVLGREVRRSLAVAMAERLGPRLVMAAATVAAESCRGEALDWEANSCDEEEVLDSGPIRLCAPACRAAGFCQARRARSLETSGRSDADGAG